jgi:hypothetical protein
MVDYYTSNYGVQRSVVNVLIFLGILTDEYWIEIHLIHHGIKKFPFVYEMHQCIEFDSHVILLVNRSGMTPRYSEQFSVRYI